MAGSLGGLLRIYSPYRPEPDEDQIGAGKHVSSAGNLLLEVQFEDPIIQIAVGRVRDEGTFRIRVQLATHSATTRPNASLKHIGLNNLRNLGVNGK